jgi:hypothetical protein
MEVNQVWDYKEEAVLLFSDMKAGFGNDSQNYIYNQPPKTSKGERVNSPTFKDPIVSGSNAEI